MDNFNDRWRASGASERANYALFLSELCDLLGVERPEPASAVTAHNTYVFERAVTFDDGEGHTSRGRVDLYKKGCFVLEAKQGADAVEPTEAEALTGKTLRRKLGTARRGTRGWTVAMQGAKAQAVRYARALPADEGWPPFLLVVDVGFCIDVYADFSRQGKVYAPFPDPSTYRILLEDLDREDIRDRLRRVWTDPASLDPTRRSAKVTRALAEQLARLAASLEAAGHPPERVAQFVTRALFSMFAEDVGLLPADSFSGLLRSYRDALDLVPDALENLWHTMDSGGFSPGVKARLPAFNGRLFKDAEALPVTQAQLDLLIQAADADWQDVEPAIFGTLLERALDPAERHMLGAHFTPRAYVERLVLPTLVEPLRAEFDAAQAAATNLLHEAEEATDPKKQRALEREAADQLQAFHHRLCRLRVLDPACGSGNFLYVALEHLKRLEGEVLNAMEGYTDRQGLLGTAAGVFDMTEGLTVTPRQFLGLEINPRAATIAEVVLWIGHLQWHRRTHDGLDDLAPPILRDFGNIRHQDAVLAWTDGEAKKAEWPEAEFIVGNPPFLGGKDMRAALGDDYTETLRRVYGAEVPDSADLVMYWWHRAAECVRRGTAERFGLITTNSVRQTFNRRVPAAHLDAKEPLRLVYAVPDHPWVDDAGGADVRVAMTVGAAGAGPGTLARVVEEKEGDLAREVTLEERQGTIRADLTIGADIAGTVALRANEGISNRGFELGGSGFIVEPAVAEELGLGRIEGLEAYIRPYRNGRDLTAIPRGVLVIDLYGLDAGDVRRRFPEVYQHLFDNVRPDRQSNRSATLRKHWWLHRRLREDLRDALRGLPRYIATVETAKHRFFQFLDTEILPDNMLVVIASDDPYHLGVLSSRFHVAWALAAGGRLGVGNDPRYNKTRCFETFPFPAATEAQQDAIRALAEELDAHRKARIAAHPKLKVTDCYNVQDKLRAGEDLDDKEQRVHRQGLVSVLRDLHDRLDAAVADAYGWPADLDDAEILERLVALNAERAAEEAGGLVRYLRPAYQNPDGGQQAELVPTTRVRRTAKQAERLSWPERLAERVQAVQQVVSAAEEPLTAAQINERFSGGRNRQQQVDGLLETLEALGLVRRTADGRYVA